MRQRGKKEYNIHFLHVKSFISLISRNSDEKEEEKREDGLHPSTAFSCVKQTCCFSVLTSILFSFVSKPEMLKSSVQNLVHQETETEQVARA